MNLLLLKPSDFIDTDHVKITDRRLVHIVDVHRAQEGDSLRVGVLNGKIGSGQIQSLSKEAAIISVNLSLEPPKPIPLTLILSLPRPQMLKRTLQTLATMGVKDIHLINSNRVEKSFWQSPQLNDEAIEEQLILGLEQARDTLLPKITFHKRFRPFIEDNLENICSNAQRLVAHPSKNALPCPINSQQDITLAIGPEGGFVDFEIEKFTEAGFEVVHLGERILRVETAVPVLLSRLFPA